MHNILKARLRSKCRTNVREQYPMLSMRYIRHDILVALFNATCVNSCRTHVALSQVQIFFPKLPKKSVTNQHGTTALFILELPSG